MLHEEVSKLSSVEDFIDEVGNSMLSGIRDHVDSYGNLVLVKEACCSLVSYTASFATASMPLLLKQPWD